MIYNHLNKLQDNSSHSEMSFSQQMWETTSRRVQILTQIVEEMAKGYGRPPMLMVELEPGDSRELMSVP